MNVSDAGLYALALHEGLVPGPYLDSVKVWTYGIGHTAAAGAPDPEKMKRGVAIDLDGEIAKVLQLFDHDIQKYAADVGKAVKVPLKQHQFDALVSFHYNTGAIAKASLTKKLNAGDYKGAADGFMAWIKPASLKERREAERALFLHGTYPIGTVTVWGVTTSGAVVWKPLKRIDKAQFLALLNPSAPKSAPVLPHVNETPESEHDAPDVLTKPGWLAAFIAALVALFKRNSA